MEGLSTSFLLKLLSKASSGLLKAPTIGVQGYVSSYVFNQEMLLIFVPKIR